MAKAKSGQSDASARPLKCEWLRQREVAVTFDAVQWLPAVKIQGPPTEDGRKAGSKEVLADSSWEVKGSDRVGLIGANGCGKSTQLLMILGLLEPTSGSITKSPEDLRIGYMQQEANLDGDATVFGVLHEVFGDRDLEEIDADLVQCSEEAASGDGDMDACMAKLDALVDERGLAEEHIDKVDELISKLGLLTFRNSYLRELSGGWQMRVALGILILQQPDLLLLDEPTNHIDLETVEFMEDFLNAQEIPMVIVSHDRYFLNAVCTKIVEVYRGNTTSYDGNYLSYLNARDRTLAFEWKRWQRYQERCDTIRRQINKLQERRMESQAAKKRDELQALLENPVAQPEVNDLSCFTFPVEPAGEEVEEEEPVLVVDGLQVSFGDKEVLRGVSVSVQAGEKVAIVGANGCGKSTLVKSIVGELQESGLAEVHGTIQHSGGISYFPQRLAESLNNEEGSVKDALYLSCSSADIEAAGGMDSVLRRLRLAGVTQDQPVSTLSGGEKARVAFANFLLSPCRLLVLDEPTNHLDIPTRELLEDALKEFQGAVLVVSHDRFFLREFARRVIAIVDGQAVEYDSWEAYEAAAPKQWQQASEDEQDFILQDARAKTIWSNKKMARIAKKQVNVGLRRLSDKAEDLVELIQAEQAQRRRSREEVVTEGLIAKGVDPALLGVTSGDSDTAL